MCEHSGGACNFPSGYCDVMVSVRCCDTQRRSHGRPRDVESRTRDVQSSLPRLLPVSLHVLPV